MLTRGGLSTDRILRAIGKAIYATYIAAIFLFLVGPIAVVIIMSFNSALYISFPPRELSLIWYAKYFSDPIYISSSQASITVGLAAVICSTIIGTLAAYSLHRYRPPLHGIINALLLSPLLLPGVVMGLALTYTFSFLGIQRSLLGVVIGHSLYVLPFVVVLVSAALQNCERSLEETAMSLGATEAYAFRTITLPLVFPGIVSGALFALIMSLDEFIITFLLAGVHVITLPIRIFSSLKFAVDPTITAASTVFIFATTVLYLFALGLRRRQGL